MRSVNPTALMGPVMLLACCAPSGMTGGFDSPLPASKLYAIQRAAQAGDASPGVLRAIVEELDSDDPAVRLVAIGALERLTGETHGFRADDSPIMREAAIQRWVDALGPPPDSPSESHPRPHAMETPTHGPEQHGSGQPESDQRGPERPGSEQYG
jgi:hypothetical protein